MRSSGGQRFCPVHDDCSMEVHMPFPLTQEHTVADSNQPIEFRWLPRQAAPVPRSGHTRAEPSNVRKVRCRPESVTESAANMECNVADLLDRARLLLSQCQPDVAVKFIERAIERDPNDMAALDMLAEVLLELDRTEEAVRALRRSIDLYPNSNANKYMSLAQLLSGREALGLYERGIQLMLSGIDRDDSSVAAAYSAIAELFMTDLCDEDNAESNCEAAVEAAVNVCSDCPDPYRVMASLRIIQGRYEEAEAAVRSGLERIASSPFETRLDLAKSCIELGMFTNGLDLVDDLLGEDDRDCQLWVMAALCYLKEGNAEIAVEYCHAARAMALKQDDREMLNEIDAIQHELDNTPTI